MPLDPNISLQVQTPNPMNTISGMVDMQNKLLQYQTGKATQQATIQRAQAESAQAQAQSQAAVQARAEQQNVSQAMQNDPDFKPNPDGTYPINQNTLGKLQQIAPQTWATYAQQGVAHNQAVTTANKSLIDLNQDQMGIVSNVLNAIPKGTPISGIGTALIDLKKQIPSIAPFADQYIDKLNQVSTTAQQNNLPAEQVQNTVDGLVSYFRDRGMTVAGQQAANTPSLVAMPNGQQTSYVNIKPGVTGIPQNSVVANVQQQLPPTQPAFVNGAPTVIGPQPTGTVPVQTGPTLGQPETAQVPVLAMKTDWDATQAAGSKAAQNIGVLQNIKQYAPGAVTGVENDKRSWLAGLSGLLGMEPDQLAKTNTDLLAKNTNMLALAGGDTNLAKTLAETANPNVHMTKEAIQDASNQVIAQQKLAIAKQDYFNKFTSNPQDYSKELAQWNKIADPRVLQWNDMSVAEKSKMKAAMTPSEQKNFKAGLQFFRQNGYMQ